MLPLDILIVMHDEIRDAHQLEPMIDYVRGGGVWSEEAIKTYAAESGDRHLPIYIAKFPDHAMYVHDGHRRITATFLGGRYKLYPFEYVQDHWRYEDYMEISWERGYVTPHDPRTEVRLPEFFKFKQEAMALYKEDPEAAELFILDSKHRYARPRTIFSVADLAFRYDDALREESA